VAAIIASTAVDSDPTTGCRRCTVGRDSLSGWGQLDITAALESLARGLPPRDRLETNDDAGDLAPKLWGRSIVVRATVDFWDDPVDVYRVKLAAGEQVSVALRGATESDVNLVLWKPRTEHVEGLPGVLRKQRATQSSSLGPNESLRHRAAVAGWYYVEVRAAGPSRGEYALRIDKYP
jgi:hypothetical protein